MVSPVPVSRRYSAFISYRHLDNREERRHWAEWLHRELEIYNIPRDLIGRPNRRGELIPKSLYPVFRDEAELPAGVEFPSIIKQALENSAILIVVCSPRTLESTFVADEIRWFKELGRANRILALIIDGEPNADELGKSAAGIKPEAECLPEPLRFGWPRQDGSIDWSVRAQRLGADIRPGGRPEQGYTDAAAYRAALEAAGSYSHAECRRLAKEYASRIEQARMQIIAGILGISPGDLTKRDAVFRAQRFRRLAIVFGAIAVLAIGFGVVAIRQRQAAQAATRLAVAARDGAETLIDFMTVELRNRLAPVGRLDVMNEVNKRVEAYHRRFGSEDDAPDILHRRAVFWANQGDTLTEQGNLVEALASYRQCQTLAQRLVAMDSSQTPWLNTLALSYRDIAIILDRQGDRIGALASIQTGVAHASDLVKRKPKTPEWLSNLASSYGFLGDLLRKQNDLAAALVAYEKLDSLNRNLVTVEPDNLRWQRDVAFGLERIADVYDAQSDRKRALATYQAGHEQMEKVLGQDPSNTIWQRDSLILTMKVASAQSSLGNLEAAATAYRRAEVLAQKLVSHDPSNASWRRHLAITLAELGGVIGAQGDTAAAAQRYQESKNLFEVIAKQEPQDIRAQRELYIASRLVGEALASQGDFPGAMASFEQTKATIERLIKIDEGNIEWQCDLAICQEAIGRLLAQHGHWKKAAEALLGPLEFARAWIEKRNTDIEWSNRFAFAAAIRFEALYHTPPGSIKIDRSAALTDVRVAFQKLLSLQNAGATDLRTKYNLGVLERVLRRVDNHQSRKSR
jgi:tetratricopeptide (TPR) repeat protein